MEVGKIFREALLAALDAQLREHGEKVLDPTVIRAAIKDSLPEISSLIAQSVRDDAEPVLTS